MTDTAPTRTALDKLRWQIDNRPDDAEVTVHVGDLRVALDELKQLRRQRQTALSVCKYRYQYGQTFTQHFVDADDIRHALGADR